MKKILFLTFFLTALFVKSYSQGQDIYADPLNIWGKTGIGGVPLTGLHLMGEDLTYSAGAFQLSMSTAKSGLFYLLKSRGTLAAKTTLLDNDSIYRIIFSGWNGVQWLDDAQIYSIFKKNVVTGYGGLLFFDTRDVTTNLMKNRLYIDAYGNTNVANGNLYLLSTPTFASGDTTVAKTLFRDVATGEVQQRGISASGIGGWALLGNAGTVDGTNFIGTTDNVPLSFRVNNEVIGKFNYTLNNTSFCKGALESNTTGTYNIAFGYRSLNSNLTGDRNIGLGSMSGKYPTNLSNRLFINSIDRTNIVGDTTMSIIYGRQATDANTQSLYLNSQVYLPYINTVGGATDSILSLDPNTNAVEFVSPSSLVGSVGWKLLGNAGTVDGTNFIGTTDNIPLSFRVNNSLSGRIDNTLNNTFFGYQAGLANTTGNANTLFGCFAGTKVVDGTYNTAVGGGANYTNISGDRNVAVGFDALYLNLANDNVAIGNDALYGFTGCTNERVVAVGGYASQYGIGSDNVYVGYKAGESENLVTSLNTFNVGVGNYALQEITTVAATHNTAVGHAASNYNTTGAYNTSLGTNSLGGGTTGSNNIGIGAYAGLYNTLDRRLYISAFNNGSEANDSIKSIIYGRMNTTSTNQSLSLNAIVKINQAYTLPSADGTANYSMKTNGTGTVSWGWAMIDTTLTGCLNNIYSKQVTSCSPLTIKAPQVHFTHSLDVLDSISGHNIYVTDTITSIDSVISIGGLNVFMVNRTIADDSYLTPSTAINGRGWVMVSNAGTVAEWADFYFSNDGTVVLIQNSANVVTVDTDDKLVIKDNGAGITIENRLGGSRTIKLRLEY